MEHKDTQIKIKDQEKSKLIKNNKLKNTKSNFILKNFLIIFIKEKH